MPMPKAPPSATHESAELGFTLLELLISLSLTALITLLLFGALHLGGKSWESADRHVERVDEMRLVAGFIRRNLSQMQPVWFRSDKGKALLFGGDEQTLEWVSPTSEHLGLGGLMLLRLSRDAEGRQLILTRWLYHPEVLAGGDGIPRWRPLRGAGSDGDQKQYREVFGRHLLLSRLAGLELAYFGSKEADQEPRWHAQWEHGFTLPRLVRIRLLLDDGRWPDIVIRVVDVDRLHL